MRISGLVLLALTLAACGDQASRSAPNTVENTQKPASADEKVECATVGESSFARRCTVERTDSTTGAILTVRNPDGGFHRFQVVSDGRGIVAADGAEAAKVKLSGDGIEVAIGGDRYRLPATVKAKAKAQR